MEIGDIDHVISGWQDVYAEEGAAIRQMQKSLGDKDEGCVQIFEVSHTLTFRVELISESRSDDGLLGTASSWSGMVYDLVSGAEEGCADCSVPDEPQTELDRFAQHKEKHDSHLLLAYAQAEIQKEERIVATDESGWVAVVPFWATWPYEVLGESALQVRRLRAVLPYKRHIPSLLQLSEEERLGLARILQEVTVRYDNLFR